MIDKTQLLLAVTVCVAGIALWMTRESAHQNQSDSVATDVIIERNNAGSQMGADSEISQSRTITSEPKQMVQPAQAITVTDANFAELVLGSDQPVLIDFGAQWCGACRILKPVIEELANELSGQAIVAQVDVDANPRLATQFQIQALPTLLVIKDGKVVDKVVGVAPKAELRAKIDAQTGERGIVL